jgi:hypothetical protein
MIPRRGWLCEAPGPPRGRQQATMNGGTPWPAES